MVCKTDYKNKVFARTRLSQCGNIDDPRLSISIRCSWFDGKFDCSAGESNYGEKVQRGLHRPARGGSDCLRLYVVQ